MIKSAPTLAKNFNFWVLVFIFQEQGVDHFREPNFRYSWYKLPNYNEHFDKRKMETGLRFKAGGHLIFQVYVYNPVYWIRCPS